MAEPTADAQRWALLIGAGYYMSGDARKDSSGRVAQYASLGGCVNDVALIECFLKTELGLADEHIIKLTSTAPGDASCNRPEEDISAWPTHHNISRAFLEIGAKARPGDLVYIHYSGHGARVQTAYSGLKGPHGIDEALVPVDIEVLADTGADQAKYIRDIEIAGWLHCLVDKALRVTVVLDSCHAGGSARHKWEPVTRGSGLVDYSLLPSDLCGDALWAPGPHSAGSRHGELRRNWLLEASGYTLLAACTAFQKAYEHTFAERQHGALTYYLIDTLRSEPGSLSTEALLSRISAKVQSYFSEQTPVLDGDSTMAFFGIGSRAPQVYQPRILTVDLTKDLVEIDHGDLHGVHKGAEYAVYRDGTSSGEDRVARIRVTKPQGLKSVATFVNSPEHSDRAAVRPGFHALLLKQAPEKLAGVRFVMERDRSPSAEVRAWLKDVQHYVEQQALPSSLWRLLPDESDESDEGHPATFSVAITNASSYELLDASQVRLPNLPSLPVADPGSKDRLLACLSHVAQFRLVQRLRPDAVSVLKTPCRFELLGRSAEPPLDTSPEDIAGELIFPAGLQLAPFEDGTYTVSHGDVVSVVFENQGPSPVHVAVFDLKPLWGIDKLYPAGAGTSECLGPYEKRTLPIQMNIPARLLRDGQLDITETLKAIVTIAPTSMQALELPDIGDVSNRGKLPVDFATELDLLLEDLSPYYRAAALKYHRSSGSWQAYDINIRTTSVSRIQGE